jgi:carboxypeptidase PM20D1
MRRPRLWWRRLTVALALLVIVLLARTVAQPSLQVEVDEAVTIELEETQLAERLAAAIRFQTISTGDAKTTDLKPFHNLLDWFEQTYPTVYSALDAERIGASLVLTWPGSDVALTPGLFMAHLDVVPVEPGTEQDWTHPPFSGAIADGFVWGRGALDVKSGAVALHEAIQKLLADGTQPERTLYFAFGHDEEVGGVAGNGAIVSWMTDRGIQLQFVVDEGGFILDGLVPELGEQPVAMVDVAEKAYCTVHLTARGEGGHSSMPPSSTAVGRIASAIHRLEAEPFPVGLPQTLRDQLRHLAPEMPFGKRVLLSNLWLTGGLVKRMMAADVRARSLLQTTTAATMIDGGIKENVVPQQASATVNFRLLPGTTSDDVIAHVTTVIDDPMVEISLGLTTTPAPPSPTDSATYRAIARSTREIHPTAVVVPALLMGATDSRHYRELSDQVYRYTGLRLHLDDVGGFHGTNERMRVDYFADGVRIMMRMMVNLGGPLD